MSFSLGWSSIEESPRHSALPQDPIKVLSCTNPSNWSSTYVSTPTPLSAVVANGAPVDDGIMIPKLVGGADGATVDGRISVDDTNGVSIDEGSIDGAGGAAVDDGSVDEADGASIDEEISGGGELEVLALVPIGGGVVDAVASIVPVGAGTC